MWLSLLESTLRLSTPLLFAAMGGLIAERSGIATICLEGVLLIAAFASATVAYYTHSPWAGLIVGMIFGSLTLLLHAALCMLGKAQTIVSGVAVNLIASGVTPFLCHLLFHSSTNTASLPFDSRFAGLYFTQYGLTYFALVLPFLIHIFIKYSRPGMRLVACGESPSALEASGISANAIKWISLASAGAIASLGGIFLATSHASQFTRDMSAGRGFIALAAVIFGKWRPIPTFFACLFFGLADSLQIHLQSKSLFGYSFPVEFVQATPYLITLFILAGFVGKSIPPRAITEE